MGRMREKLQRFMIGRYGVDEMGRVMLYGAIFLMIVSMFVKKDFIYTAALVLLLIGYFRMFSRNISKRYEENQKYLVWKNKVFRNAEAAKRQRADKEHRYYKCPSCHQKVRVPKGRGKISICCPKCSTKFIKRT